MSAVRVTLELTPYLTTVNGQRCRVWVAPKALNDGEAVFLVLRVAMTPGKGGAIERALDFAPKPLELGLPAVFKTLDGKVTP